MQTPDIWALPEEITLRLGQKSSGKQKAMVAEGHLLLVLHRVPGKDDRTRTSVYFWRHPSGQWESSAGGDGLLALQRHVKEYDSVEERLEQAYQKAQESEDYFDILEELGPLRHATANMYHALQSAREAIPDDRELIDLRDQAANTERNVTLLQEDCRHGLEYRSARKAEEQAQFGQQAAIAGHRLNILAAIFFPLTALSGLFGMNLPSGLEGAPLWLFWMVFASGIVLGFFMKGWVVRAGVGK